MRRTPLRRKTPLARSPMRRGAESSAYRDRPRDVGYMLWVKRQRCLMRGVWGTCDGPVHADHAGANHGAGRKAHDSTVIPLCRFHHVDASRFPLTGWPQERRRAWLRAAIVYTQALARSLGVEVPADPDPDPMAVYPATDLRTAWRELARVALAGAAA